MNIQTIPLDKLRLSPRNVRKTGGASIESLAASIHAHGLLQNLTVSPSSDGTFAVEAGSRRWRALQHLKAAGQLADDYGVSCQVLDGDAGQLAEVSLAENVLRHAMHPADEFDAFAALANEGSSVADIAARFGQTELFVRQRLKLAHVAPDILADYRAGNATLEQMMALALTDDQVMQARIWKSAKNEWQREPERLRKQITKQETSTESRLGKFVGLDAYEKAGGAIRRDLFGEEAFMQDAELLSRLALEKLQRTAEKVASKEGWLWSEARTDFPYSDEATFGTVYPQYKGNKATWTPEAKATAGVVVTIDYHGLTEIKRGLVRPQDRKAAAATANEVSGGKPKPQRKPEDMPFAAIQRLQAEATGFVRAEIAGMPRTALAMLTAELAGRAFYDHSDYGTAQRQWIRIDREQSGRMPGNLRELVATTAAGKALSAIETTWRKRLPKKKADLRAWLLEQEFDTITRLLAFLAAREFDLVDIDPTAKQGVVDAAAAAQVDLSQHWFPTEEWLATLPKAVVIALAKDAGAGDVDLAALAKSPKATLAAQALPHFPTGWLPPALRGRAAPKPKAAASKKAITKVASRKKTAKKPARKATGASKSRKAGAK